VRTVLVALFAIPCFALASDFRLINGTPVQAGTFRDVVRIQSGGAACTATVVGPRVIVTAAHCANNGATATFSIDGKSYSATMTRSSLYPGKDHDVSLGLVSQDITGVEPASIGGTATVGLGITLLGYGCINVGGGGGNDGILRIGDSAITGFSAYDMVSRKANGAALCFGDSGGPAFLVEGSRRRLLGINSKGNIKDTNYNTRLDITESKTFLTNYAQQNGVKICGVNQDCGGSPPPPPGAPTCSLTASPFKIKLGENVTISIVTQGQVTAATIEGASVGFPTGSKSLHPGSTGTFTAQGTVSGPGGQGTCQAQYTVDPQDPQPGKPSCSLAALPSEIQLGETLTLEMVSAGTISSATIDGFSVASPLGKRIIQPAQKGTFTANGTVSGTGGTGSCQAVYVVKDTGPPPPPPETPNLAVVPSHCGDNTVIESKVSRVCLAVVKKDQGMLDIRVTQALLVIYSDATREVLPLLSRRPRPKPQGDLLSKEDLTLYANGSVAATDYQVLDTRAAVLTVTDTQVPVAVEGRTVKGRYFLVENLKSHGISP